MKSRAQHCVVGVLFSALVFLSPVQAQQVKAPGPPAPVPAPIASAKRVFISNSGAECTPLAQTWFGGGPDRAYNEFYSGITEWGRQKIVGDPGQADLVMEIHFHCPMYVEENIVKIDPQFRVNLIDPHTHIQLWGVVEHFNCARLQENRDKDFSAAMKGLLDRLRDITALAAASGQGP